MKTEDLPKKIAVLMGGPGSERDVSLATGRGVSKALRSLGADVVDVDVRDEDFQLPKMSIWLSSLFMELSARMGRCKKFWRTAAFPTLARASKEAGARSINF